MLEDALVRAEIPYHVIGGTKFYERAEIKDAVAYLSLLANPSDQVSFTRVANSPRRGIGQTSLSRVIAHAASFAEPVWEVAAAAPGVPGPRTRGDHGDRAVHGHHGGAARAGATPASPVAELLEAVLTRSGYLDALSAERTFEAQGRIENLDELVGGGAGIRRRRRWRTAASTPSSGQIALVSDADTRTDDRGQVTLMTLHNAKGVSSTRWSSSSGARKGCSHIRARLTRAPWRRSAGSATSGSLGRCAI